MSRRHVLRAWVTGGLAVALSACVTPLPNTPPGFRRTPIPLSLVVGDAYCHYVRGGNDSSHPTNVVDDAIRHWTHAAEERLQGRVTLPVRVVDMARVSLWDYATLLNASGEDAGQTLYFGTHVALARLRAGGLLRDVGEWVRSDRSLGAGTLHGDALACLSWGGMQAGLPVALWPALLAADAALPAPHMGWQWEDVVIWGEMRSSGWPLQLLPGAPPLESWLWPRKADIIAADGVSSVVDQPEAIVALSSYAGVFGPIGAKGKLSPIPGGQAQPQAEPTQRIITFRNQQIRERTVMAWFPPEDWPPVSPSPHSWQDEVGRVHRIPVPGATRGGLPVIAYGIGIRYDVGQPESAYAAARALQDMAASYLAYSPFTREQTTDALRRQWPQLDADQAGVVTSLFRLRLRPAWSVPSGRLLGSQDMGSAQDIVTPALWDRPEFLQMADLNDMLSRLSTSLALVLALGLLPPEVAARHASHALQTILTRWTTIHTRP